jgi:transposase InsO family protein
MRYQWIKKHRRHYPLALMCQVLQVSTSGFYDWLKRPPSKQQQRKEKIAQAATRFYFESYRIYGYRKVWEDLIEQNIICCPETVRRVLRDLGLFSRTKRKFVVTTDSKHSEPVADNLLKRDFTAVAPNQKWLTDITYIPTRQGWLYLAAVLDVFSRRVVGWSMSERIDTELTKSALSMATVQREVAPGLLHHSDRGVQYASEAYQQKLADLEIICSMSGKGDCWDNAMMESFFGSLKTEWIYGKDYSTRQEAKQDVFKYIELFYNRQRRHASLDYVSPAEFEKRYEVNQDQEQAA